jgi:hypothetical protein
MSRHTRPNTWLLIVFVVAVSAQVSAASEGRSCIQEPTDGTVDWPLIACQIGDDFPPIVSGKKKVPEDTLVQVEVTSAVRRVQASEGWLRFIKATLSRFLFTRPLP